jgi:hypothetical protein
VTACQLLALAAARNAGVDVRPETIDAGVSYLKRCQNPDGGFRYLPPGGGSAFPRSAAALAASLASLKWTEPASRPDATLATDYLMRFLPAAGDSTTHAPFFIHGHYHAGLALQAVGGDSWKRWQDAVRDDLLATQDAHGSWSGEGSVELATSEACLILHSAKAARPETVKPATPVRNP